MAFSKHHVYLRLFAHCSSRAFADHGAPHSRVLSEAPVCSARGCTHKATVSIAVQYMILEVNCGNCLHSCRAEPRKHLSIEDDWREARDRRASPFGVS